MKCFVYFASGIMFFLLSAQLQAVSGTLAGLSQRTASPVPNGDFPYVALLEFNKVNGFSGACASILIAPNTLLTSKTCADMINKSISARAIFVSASGKPQYTVSKGIPYSFLQEGPLNQLGIIHLAQEVKDIDPLPFNQNDTLIETSLPLVFVGPDGFLPEGVPEPSTNIDALTQRTAWISEPDRCSNIANMNSSNSSIFCVTGDASLPSHCSEDLGGPFFLNQDGQYLLLGVLTESKSCSGANNSLIAASTSELKNQDFILRYQGTLGGQSWALREDNGKTPPGVYSFAGSHACVADINGTRYTGYYFDTASEFQTGPDRTLDRGCMVIREHTACAASQFYHVVGAVPAAWTVLEGSPDDKRISFTGSDDDYPCVRDDADKLEFEGLLFPTILAGRWNADTNVCETFNRGETLPGCESLADNSSNANLIKMPGDRTTGILTRLSPATPEKNFLEELIWVSVGLGTFILVEAGALVVTFIALIVTCKKLHAPPK